VASSKRHQRWSLAVINESIIQVTTSKPQKGKKNIIQKPQKGEKKSSKEECAKIPNSSAVTYNKMSNETKTDELYHNKHIKVGYNNSKAQERRTKFNGETNPLQIAHELRTNGDDENYDGSIELVMTATSGKKTSKKPKPTPASPTHIFNTRENKGKKDKDTEEDEDDSTPDEQQDEPAAEEVQKEEISADDKTSPKIDATIPLDEDDSDDSDDEEYEIVNAIGEGTNMTTFSGKPSEDIDEWIRKFDRYKKSRSKPWNGEWRMNAANLILLLSGDALTSAENLKVDEIKDEDLYEHYKKHLLKKYKSISEKAKYEGKLDQITLQHGERLDNLRLSVAEA